MAATARKPILYFIVFTVFITFYDLSNTTEHLRFYNCFMKTAGFYSDCFVEAELQRLFVVYRLKLIWTKKASPHCTRFAVTKWSKHGQTSLVISESGHLLDLTICMDIQHQFYTIGDTPIDVNDKMVDSADSASKWYKANFLKGNLDKYQTMMLGNKNVTMNNIIIDNYEVKSTKCLKLLGVEIDDSLRFDVHINNTCKKGSKRVGVLMRLRNLIPTETKLQLYKAAILPYLTYCHLVWHLCRSSDARRLERIQQRALRAVFCDKSSTYDTLLSMAGLCSLRNRRLQDIGILMYKVMHNLCPNYISSFFKFPNSSYILRNNDFIIPRFNTVTYGRHSLRYIGPKLWAALPKLIRESPSLSSFETKIRQMDLVTVIDDRKCTTCVLCNS